jgi:hypothetical protein
VSFFELFQPGLKYLREEKDRQKILIAKPSHGGGAPLGIDLDAGTAKITIAPKPDRDRRLTAQHCVDDDVEEALSSRTEEGAVWKAIERIDRRSH